MPNELSRGVVGCEPFGTKPPNYYRQDDMLMSQEQVAQPHRIALFRNACMPCRKPCFGRRQGLGPRWIFCGLDADPREAKNGGPLCSNAIARCALRSLRFGCSPNSDHGAAKLPRDRLSERSAQETPFENGGASLTSGL